jgi:hypothetical protein
MSRSGLLYANSTAIAGADGVWIAVADPDGTLLAHEHLVGQVDVEYVNLLAVKLAAGLLAYPYDGVGRGVIVTDSTWVVAAMHPYSAPQPQTELARRRVALADEIRAALGVGWVVAWAPRHVNLATTALTSHLRDSATSTPATTEAP